MSGRAFQQRISWSPSNITTVCPGVWVFIIRRSRGGQFSVNPFLEPVITYCQLDPQEENSMKFKNICHFIQNSKRKLCTIFFLKKPTAVLRCIRIVVPLNNRQMGFIVSISLKPYIAKLPQFFIFATENYVSKLRSLIIGSIHC